MRPITVILLAWVMIAPAQQNQPAVPKGTVKFESNVQLVVVDVSVKDKSGNPIEGLTDKDFTITEDGKPQAIKVFKFQRLEEETRPVPALAPRPQPKIVAEEPAQAGRKIAHRQSDRAVETR